MIGPETNVIGRRIGAWIVDLLIWLAVLAALFFALAKRTTGIAPSTGIDYNLTVNETTYYVAGTRGTLLTLLLVGVGLLLTVLLPTLTGATIGKFATGVRVAGPDGRAPAGLGRNLLRQLLWVIDGFPYFLPCLVGLTVMLLGDEDRRVGDMAAGTYVVRRRAGLSQGAAGGPGAGVGSTPAGWYPDPYGQARLRWWNGRQWTEQITR